MNTSRQLIRVSSRTTETWCEGHIGVTGVAAKGEEGSVVTKGLQEEQKTAEAPANLGTPSHAASCHPLNIDRRTPQIESI